LQEATLLIICVLLGAAAGAAIPFMAKAVNAPLVIVLLCATQVAFLICRFKPVFALGLLVASQVLDTFQVQTPIASVSVRTALIALLALSQFPNFLARLKGRAELRVTFVLLLAWLAIYPLRMLHTPADVVLRALVTNASFIAIAMIGASLAESKNVLRTVAGGAALALGVLGSTGVLVSLGYLSAPDRVSLSRSLFGVTSPFVRTYGLDVPFDAVALLTPLCVPFLAVTMLGRKERSIARIVSLLLLVGITLASGLVFQARGMLLDIGLVLFLSAWLTGYRSLRIIAASVSLLLIPTVVNLIFSDEISSGLRIATAQAVIEEVAANPASLLLGSNQDLLYARGAEMAGAAAAISYVPGANVIHNLFLQNLADGGILAALLIGVAHLVLAYYAVRLWRANPAGRDTQVLLIAVAVVLLELNLEPVRANIVGSWLVMGLCLGRQVTRPRTIRDADSSAPYAWSSTRTPKAPGFRPWRE
jgi:hypothetical protein